MRLVDTTLREGEQCFGVYFTPEAKREILTLLDRVGVEEIELGVAGRDESLPGLAEFARSLPGRPMLTVWAACREKDLRQAVKANPDAVHMGLPVSAAHMQARLGLEPAGALDLLARNIGLARSLGFSRVSLGLEDASRADPDFVIAAARAAEQAGAWRVRLSDTVGVWNPGDVERAVSRLAAAVGIEIGVHCHNDFGMGTANAVAGLLAGAASADASVLGLGERAGLTALEELAAYLHLRKAKPYNVAGLRPLCLAVARAAGEVIPPRKPIAGEKVFACETGLHVHALMKDPALFEPFAPGAVGLGRASALGKKSGRGAVAAVMARLGINPAGRDVEALVDAVRARSEALGRPLTDEEARLLLENTQNAKGRDMPESRK